MTKNRSEKAYFEKMELFLVKFGSDFEERFILWENVNI